MALSRPLTLGEKVLSAQINVSSSGVLTMHTIEIGTGLASSCMGSSASDVPTGPPVFRYLPPAEHRQPREWKHGMG